MLKMVTWIGLALSVLSTVVDLAKPDSSSGTDAVEAAMLASLLVAPDAAHPAGPESPRNTSR